MQTMKFRKKPVVIEASKWNGEFDEVIVQYQDTRRDDPKRKCQHCGNEMKEHGWIDTLEGGHIVCPGDWVITGVKGERYSCKPDIFVSTYEPAE